MQEKGCQAKTTVMLTGAGASGRGCTAACSPCARARGRQETLIARYSGQSELPSRWCRRA